MSFEEIPSLGLLLVLISTGVGVPWLGQGRSPQEYSSEQGLGHCHLLPRF